MMPPKSIRQAALTDDSLTVDGGTMKEPGFLRAISVIEVIGQNGKTYRGLARLFQFSDCVMNVP
jgi:cephalosporin-C deacetylase